MGYNVVFLEKANLDIVLAFKYFSEININLANNFTHNLELTVSDIQKTPLGFIKIKGNLR